MRWVIVLAAVLGISLIAKGLTEWHHASDANQCISGALIGATGAAVLVVNAVVTVIWVLV